MGKSETNKNGVYGKYIIRRTDGTEIDPNDEYFVLKVKGSGDPKHIESCRQALLAYAKEIQSYLPDLAHDIDMRYGDYPVKNSHSPTISKTETVPDTLQEGDYATRLTRNEWESITKGKFPFYSFSTNGGIVYKYGQLSYRVFKDEDYNGVNNIGKLEFIRRAENTFKTC